MTQYGSKLSTIMKRVRDRWLDEAGDSAGERFQQGGAVEGTEAQVVGAGGFCECRRAVEGGPEEPGIGARVVADACPGADTVPDRPFDEHEGTHSVRRVAAGGEHELVARGVVPREPHVGAARRDQGARWVILVVENGLDSVAQFFEARGQHGRDDRPEIREVLVDRRGGNARLTGNAPQGKAGRIIRFVDDGDRGGDYLVMKSHPAAAGVPDSYRGLHTMTLQVFSHEV